MEKRLEELPGIDQPTQLATEIRRLAVEGRTYVDVVANSEKFMHLANQVEQLERAALKRPRVFLPPTLDMCVRAGAEFHPPMRREDAESFWDYYDSKG